MIGEVHITLCDHLNPGFGYQIRIVSDRGETMLFTSRDPVTASNLHTYSDALRVANMYAEKPTYTPDPNPCVDTSCLNR